jgi:hypothetical protein
VSLFIITSLSRYPWLTDDAGARLGVSDNTDDNRAVFGWRLTKEDHAMIASVLQKSDGGELIQTIGDCGAEYR